MQDGRQPLAAVNVELYSSDTMGTAANVDGAQRAQIGSSMSSSRSGRPSAIDDTYIEDHLYQPFGACAQPQHGTDYTLPQLFSYSHQ